MRVVVTGVQGHVGGAIAATMAEDGDEVVGVGRRPPTDAFSAGEYVELDLGRPGAGGTLAARVGSCDAVVHAAADVSFEPLSSDVVLSNCLGAQEMVAAARACGAARFVFISSIGVVGEPTSPPVTESHPLDPQTEYHASKLFGELVTRGAANDLAGTILRLSAPVGPGGSRSRILPAFVAWALAGEPVTVFGDGSRRQDFVDVRDVARASGAALTRSVAGTFNIASGRTISNRELAERCISRLGSSSALVHTGIDPEDGVTWEISVDRAREALGWEAERRIEDSIDAVADQMRS